MGGAREGNIGRDELAVEVQVGPAVRPIDAHAYVQPLLLLVRAALPAAGGGEQPGSAIRLEVEVDDRLRVR